MRVLADPSGSFTLEVPDGWEASTEDCVTTLRTTSGLGTVWLSGARHVHGRQRSFGRADFLVRFLQSLGLAVGEDDVTPVPAAAGHLFTFAHETPQARWRYWTMTDDETAVLIGYAREGDPLADEERDVRDLVLSLRLFPSGPIH